MTTRVGLTINPAALEAWRLERGVGVNELGRRARMDGASLYRVRNGTRTGSDKVIRRLADALQVSIADITGAELDKCPTCGRGLTELSAAS